MVFFVHMDTHLWKAEPYEFCELLPLWQMQTSRIQKEYVIPTRLTCTPRNFHLAFIFYMISATSI